MIPNHLTEWLGLPVVDWDPESGAPDYANKIYRLRYIPPKRSGFLGRKKEETINVFEEFTSRAGVEDTQGLSVCSMADYGGDVANDISLLLSKKDKFPNLRALFLGELDQDECELSWIVQGNVTPILETFPGLEDLRIRGGADLVIGKTRHICLRKLVIETGGLTVDDVLPGLQGSIFPELEHLEIWGGEENYGWDGRAEDFRWLFYDNPFPKLKHLGLRNSEVENEIALLAADAPVLDQLETLDLSLGTLQDSGGTALLESERIKSLKRLDLHHHFMNPELTAKFEASGLNVDVSERLEPDDPFEEPYYYIAVGE